MAKKPTKKTVKKAPPRRPIALYYWSTPNGHKISIMLEELGVPYEVHPVNSNKGEQFAPALLKISPNHRMPAIVDPDGPGGRPISVFESGAILVYLAEKYGRFLAPKGAARYAALEWLAVQLSTVGPMFGQYTHFKMFAPPGNEYGESRYRTQAVRVFEALDSRLSKARFLAGDDYSIADLPRVFDQLLIRDSRRRIVGLSAKRRPLKANYRASRFLKLNRQKERG